MKIKIKFTPQVGEYVPIFLNNGVISIGKMSFDLSALPIGCKVPAKAINEKLIKEINVDNDGNISIELIYRYNGKEPTIETKTVNMSFKGVINDRLK